MKTKPPKRALVVDDDASVRSMIREVLEGEGFSVFEAVNGRFGIDLLRTQQPIAVIITDILMPEADGFEFLIEARRVLAQFRTSAKIIAISGGGTFADASFYLEPTPMLGADVALSKPFSDETLRAALGSSGQDLGEDAR